jgi:hypothetical protein
VVARPVFRVGAGAAAPPAAPPQQAGVAPPVPPAGVGQRPLPPRVQGPGGAPAQPALLDPAFGGRPGAAQARQPDNIFGEDLVSEKSLDEVILNYLADDLKPPPK